MWGRQKAVPHVPQKLGFCWAAGFGTGEGVSLEGGALEDGLCVGRRSERDGGWWGRAWFRLGAVL